MLCLVITPQICWTPMTSRNARCQMSRTRLGFSLSFF